MVVPILFQFGCTKPVPSWLYQTCSIGSRRGQNKPLLVPWHKSYTHDGGLSLCHGTSSIPRWSLYLFHLCQLVPTCAKKWVYKARFRLAWHDHQCYRVKIKHYHSVLYKTETAKLEFDQWMSLYFSIWQQIETIFWTYLHVQIRIFLCGISDIQFSFFCTPALKR